MYCTNLRRLQSYQVIFPNHNGMKLEINRRKTRKFTSTWKLNNTPLNNQWVIEKIKREIRKYLERNKNKNTTSKTYGMQKSNIKRE